MAVVDGEGIKIGNGASKYNELPFFLKPFVSGMIILWSGSIDNIPVGWALCNGQNGTPDLTDKFIIGAGNKYNIGATGGEEQVTLTEEQIPSHNHDILNGAITNSTTSGTVTISTSSFFGSKNFKVASNTENRGGGQPHNNMPPYYALCYIMKI